MKHGLFGKIKRLMIIGLYYAIVYCYRAFKAIKRFNIKKFLDENVIALGEKTLSLWSNSVTRFKNSLVIISSKFTKKSHKRLFSKGNLTKIANRIIHFPNSLNKFLMHSDHKKIHLHEHSQEAYLRKLESLCECLPFSTIFLQFVLLPMLFLLSLMVVYSYGIHHENEESFSISYTIPTIVRENIARNNIESMIRTANIRPMSLLPEDKIRQLNSRPAVTRANQLEYVAVTISKSIFLSGKRAGLSAKMIHELIEIFSGKVDVYREIHDGDKFVLLYRNRVPSTALSKSKHKHNVKTSPGKEILVAELIKKNKAYRAIKFTDSNGRSAYYSPDGVSIKPSFVRAPVNYTHISSKFSYFRLHPVLGFSRAHLGVDFAAPHGTPIKATADGVVEFRGYKGNYGNMVIIKHDNGKYSTKYAHLSRFAKNAYQGKVVRQNEVIGYLGSTGLSTGPHVHYELSVYGIPRDPLKVALPHFSIPSGRDKTRFFILAKSLLARLENYGGKRYYANNTEQQKNKSFSTV